MRAGNLGAMENMYRGNDNEAPDPVKAVPSIKGNLVARNVSTSEQRINSERTVSIVTDNSERAKTLQNAANGRAQQQGVSNGAKNGGAAQPTPANNNKAQADGDSKGEGDANIPEESESNTNISARRRCEILKWVVFIALLIVVIFAIQTVFNFLGELRKKLKSVPLGTGLAIFTFTHIFRKIFPPAYFLFPFGALVLMFLADKVGVYEGALIYQFFKSQDLMLFPLMRCLFRPGLSQLMDRMEKAEERGRQYQISGVHSDTTSSTQNSRPTPPCGTPGTKRPGEQQRSPFPREQRTTGGTATTLVEQQPERPTAAPTSVGRSASENRMYPQQRSSSRMKSLGPIAFDMRNFEVRSFHSDDSTARRRSKELLELRSAEDRYCWSCDSDTRRVSQRARSIGKILGYLKNSNQSFSDYSSGDSGFFYNSKEDRDKHRQQNSRDKYSSTNRSNKKDKTSSNGSSRRRGTDRSNKRTRSGKSTREGSSGSVASEGRHNSAEEDNSHTTTQVRVIGAPSRTERRSSSATTPTATPTGTPTDRTPTYRMSAVRRIGSTPSSGADTKARREMRERIIESRSERRALSASIACRSGNDALRSGVDTLRSSDLHQGGVLNRSDYESSGGLLSGRLNIMGGAAASRSNNTLEVPMPAGSAAVRIMTHAMSAPSSQVRTGDHQPSRMSQTTATASTLTASTASDRKTVSSDGTSVSPDQIFYLQTDESVLGSKPSGPSFIERVLPMDVAQAIRGLDTLWRETMKSSSIYYRYFVMVCWMITLYMDDYITLLFFACRLGPRHVSWILFDTALITALVLEYPYTVLKARVYLGVANEIASASGDSVGFGDLAGDLGDLAVSEVLIIVVFVGGATVYVHGNNLLLLFQGLWRKIQLCGADDVDKFDWILGTSTSTPISERLNRTANSVKGEAESIREENR